jgi:hypothetical protein
MPYAATSCAILTVVAALQHSAADDDDTLARFRREYPPAGARVEAVYSHLRIEFIAEYFKQEEFSHSNRVLFLRDGPRFRYEHEHVTPFGGLEAGHKEFKLANDTMLVEATRPGPETELSVIALPINDARRRASLIMCFERQLPSLFDLYGIGLERGNSIRLVDWLRTQRNGGARTDSTSIVAGTSSFTMTDVTQIRESDKELVQVSWTNPLGTGYRGSLTFSPAESWIVTAYEWSTATHGWRGRFEFAGEHDGVPLLHSGSFVSLQHLPDGSVETRWDFKVVSIDPGPVAAEEFEPASIGLRNVTVQPIADGPGGSASPGVVFPAPIPSQRWYQWVALAVLAAVWIAVRRMRRRRTTTLAPK